MVPRRRDRRLRPGRPRARAHVQAVVPGSLLEAPGYRGPRPEKVPLTPFPSLAARPARRPPVRVGWIGSEAYPATRDRNAPGQWPEGDAMPSSLASARRTYRAPRRPSADAQSHVALVWLPGLRGYTSVSGHHQGSACGQGLTKDERTSGHAPHRSQSANVPSGRRSPRLGCRAGTQGSAQVTTSWE